MKKGEKGYIAKLEREREREYQTVPEEKRESRCTFGFMDSLYLWLKTTSRQANPADITPSDIRYYTTTNSSVTIQTNILYRQVKKFGMM